MRLLILVDEMNHVLKAAVIEQGQNIKAYSDPSLPVVPEVINETARLLKQAKKQKLAKWAGKRRVRVS
jgi:hypothetical protein